MKNVYHDIEEEISKIVSGTEVQLINEIDYVINLL